MSNASSTGWFDGKPKDPIEKATRDAVLAFMAAQGEADYLNRAEMQRRGGDRKSGRKIQGARAIT